MKLVKRHLKVNLITQVDLTKTEFSQNIVKDIITTSKRIDFLIDQLPGIHQSEQEQLEEIQRLQTENELVGNELKIEMHKAQELLSRVKVIHSQLLDDLKKLET